MLKIIKSLILSVVISVPASAVTLDLAPKLLKDNAGLVYIGYDVPTSALTPYLNRLESILGPKAFKRYRGAQAKRDHHSFHITLINPYEYPDIKSIDLSTLGSVSFELVGLGRGSNDQDSTYFVVVTSVQAKKIRAQYQLKPKDFHSTLGFDQADVFAVDKGLSSLIK